MCRNSIVCHGLNINPVLGQALVTAMHAVSRPFRMCSEQCVFFYKLRRYEQDTEAVLAPHEGPCVPFSRRRSLIVKCG
jgi:hypothetical protein